MINFFIKNLNSFIISTIFLLLGFLPNIFSFIINKFTGGKAYSSGININRSNNNVIGNNNIIKNSYNNSNNTYNQYNRYEYNSSYNTSPNNIDSTSSSDAFIGIIFITLIFFIFLMLFYQYIYTILMYSISISISSLILLVFIFQNLNLLNKNNSLFYYKSVWSTISIRNIFFCIIILINLLIILYNSKHTMVIGTFINIVTNPTNNSFSQKLLLVKDFIFNNGYDGYFVVSVAISIIYSIFLVFQLLSSYIWLTSLSLISKYNTSFWFAVFKKLEKRESVNNFSFWILSIFLIYILSVNWSFLFV